jgi:hypothetical protein
VLASSSLELAMCCVVAADSSAEAETCWVAALVSSATVATCSTAPLMRVIRLPTFSTLSLMQADRELLAEPQRLIAGGSGGRCRTFMRKAVATRGSICANSLVEPSIAEPERHSVR